MALSEPDRANFEPKTQSPPPGDQMAMDQSHPPTNATHAAAPVSEPFPPPSNGAPEVAPVVRDFAQPPITNGVHSIPSVQESDIRAQSTSLASKPMAEPASEPLPTQPTEPVAAELAKADQHTLDAPIEPSVQQPTSDVRDEVPPPALPTPHDTPTAMPEPPSLSVESKPQETPVQPPAGTIEPLPTPVALVASQSAGASAADNPPEPSPPAVEPAVSAAPKQSALSTGAPTPVAVVEALQEVQAEAQPPAVVNAPATPADQPAPTAAAVSSESQPETTSEPKAEPATLTDVEMADAAPPRPASPKLGRLRDEDESTDEPAAKRTKTEEAVPQTAESAIAEPPLAPETTAAATESVPTAVPQPEETPATQTLAEAATTETVQDAAPTTSTDAPAPAAATAEGEQKPTGLMTKPQQKHIQRTIGNVKRIAAAKPFTAPVDYVALKIPSYPDVITKPMDLKTLEDNLRSDKYTTVEEVVSQFNLIVDNAVKFNGPEHPVTKNAFGMKASFDKHMEGLPSADVTGPAPKKKLADPVTIRPPPPRRESRTAAAPPVPPAASAPSAPSPVSAGSPPQSFALGPDGVPLIRRDSALDGRPKREIHKPPPRDLPYNSMKPKKKKFQMELKFCDQVLKEISKPKYAQASFPFMTPVDPVALNIPTYLNVVKKPMDFGTIRSKLDRGEYENAKEFEADSRQVFKNCYIFNPEGDGVNLLGHRFEQIFSDEWAKKKEWLEENTPSSGQRSPADSDDEGSDSEDEEEDEAAEEGYGQNEIVARLQKQIAEMSKQVELITNTKKTPPAASGKKSGKDGGKSGGKSGRKEGKSGKSSSSGKKSSKSGGSKKEKIPYVTYEQKQDISNRINALSESKMSQALTIIRNNMPNLKGVHEEELELDIDELSNDVLFKLLQFVRKHVPRPDDSPLRIAPASSGAGSSAPSAARKKNKPMSKSQQEARIAQVQSGLSAFQRGGATSPSGTVHQSIEGRSDDEDDDDEDSESEEE